jgi:hypothetical protein
MYICMCACMCGHLHVLNVHMDGWIDAWRPIQNQVKLGERRASTTEVERGHPRDVTRQTVR